MNDVEIDKHLRGAWKGANLVPLWESPLGDMAPIAPDHAMHWQWQSIRPLLNNVMQLTSPEVVERRVVLLANDRPRGPLDQSTARTLSAGIQMLLPGERARPHRHTMNALRFVLEGSGATTVVDGKSCPMDAGDLILTPGWTWHEHRHDGVEPILWLDLLDAPLHGWLGTRIFEAGPVNDKPETLPDQSFAVANMLPILQSFEKTHSPVFRYPYRLASDAVMAAPAARDGSRRVRYSNPLTGGEAMNLIDIQLLHIGKEAPTAKIRSNSNAILCVVEGEGESIIGEKTICWGPKDVFTIPQGNWARHIAIRDHARLLVASDRDAFRRLGLLREEYEPLGARNEDP